MFNGETILKGFETFENLEKFLKELNTKKDIKLPNGDSIINEPFLEVLKSKIENFNNSKFNNSKINREELIKINNKTKVEKIKYIDLTHFYIWIIGPNNNMLSWSVKTLKEDIVKTAKIIDYKKY